VEAFSINSKNLWQPCHGSSNRTAKRGSGKKKYPNYTARCNNITCKGHLHSARPGSTITGYRNDSARKNNDVRKGLFHTAWCSSDERDLGNTTAQQNNGTRKGTFHAAWFFILKSWVVCEIPQGNAYFCTLMLEYPNQDSEKLVKYL
jgi:hypothetical protein